MKNLAKSLTLFSIGPLIDDRLLLSVAVGNLTRPVKQHHPIQAFQPRLIKMAFLDHAASYSFAVAMGGG
jgi:hypothetical protein